MDQGIQSSEPIGWSGDEAVRAAGISVDEAAAGRSVLSMTVRADMVNGFSVCHGGYVFLLADSAMAYASNSGEAVSLAAASQIDFLAPAQLGDRLVAEAVTQWSGGRTSLHDVAVKDQSGRLIARFHGRTMKVTPPVNTTAPESP